MDYFGESVSNSDKWIGLMSKLDKLKPVKNVIHFLHPNKSWTIETKLSLSVPTEKYKDSFFPKREYWENILKRNKVWIKILGQSWSLNLEPNKINNDKLNFGAKLQKRWSKYGYLWLDDIVSEPIPLDLSSAVIKTVEN
jgi:hypothetical protein